MTADLPTARLSELFNVNHFVVSQTNPHAIPFMSKPRALRRRREHDAAARPSWALRCCRAAGYLLSSEIAHRFRQARPPPPPHPPRGLSILTDRDPAK